MNPPETIEGYGPSTAKEFAWFHVRDGRVINAGAREAAAREFRLDADRRPR